MTAHESLFQSHCWCCGEPAPIRGEVDPWEGRMDGYCYSCASTRCDTTDSVCAVKKPDGDYVSACAGFWTSLWLVLRGARIRRWEWWDAAKPRPWHEWLDEDDFAVIAMDEADE